MKRALVAAFIIIAVTVGGVLYVKHVRSNSSLSKSQTQQQIPTNSSSTKTTDPTEGGKYLVIKEWNVRFALPIELNNRAVSELSSIVTDPDGNLIQQAKIFIASDPANDGECATENISNGNYIDSAIQLLRVEEHKSFNTSRYNGNTKEVLRTDKYNYFINYITPGCAGPVTVQKIEKLQNTAMTIQKY